MAGNNAKQNIEKVQCESSSSRSSSSNIARNQQPTRKENMLLSTTYAVNNSDTKRMQVGLRANDAGEYEVVIKLLGNSTECICLDLDTWGKFQEKFEDVNSYLRGADKIASEPLVLNNVIIHFTSAYGSKAIMVTYNRKSEEKKKCAETEIPERDEAPPMKKRKIYTPSVVMQKTTFEGVENVAGCLDVRCKQLHSLADLVNNCARYLIAEIELNLPNRYLDEDMVKTTLRQNFREIEKNVQRQLANFSFLDAYFEILFTELTSLHINEIVQKIIKNQMLQLAFNQ